VKTLLRAPWSRILVAVVIAQVACTSAPDGAESRSPGASVTPSGSPSGEPGIIDTITLELPERGSFLVRGLYPFSGSRCVDAERPRLLARYPGDMTIERTEDGRMSVTVTLSFDRYLEGIAEVPPSWPRAALEAQAIAARTYALATTDWSGEEGETLPNPICATTACQVYRGIPVPPDPNVTAWHEAVRATDGQVLLYEGSPAETVYFSTSNGRTYGNDEVFGSSPLPYLRSVVERDDGASPLSRWRVRLPFADLATFLHEAGHWPPRREIEEVTLDAGTVTVSGEGRSAELESSTFREAVNTWAPCLIPHRYPGPSWRSTPLPVTIPSRWMRISPTDVDAVDVSGRGWGHGAGMVQWGAYGKALRGLSAPDILAFYYGGLRPEPYPEPGLIHVEVASGLRSLRIVPSRPGATLDGHELGSERVSILGGDTLTATVEPR
jgi:stage II sporulation protein D